MNDDDSEFAALQRTLKQFAPAPLPAPLCRSLEAAITRQPSATHPSRLADRILLLWTTSGALAACLVAILTLWQLAATPRRAPASTQDIALQQQAQQEIQQLLASR